MRTQQFVSIARDKLALDAVSTSDVLKKPASQRFKHCSDPELFIEQPIQDFVFFLIYRQWQVFSTWIADGLTLLLP